MLEIRTHKNYLVKGENQNKYCFSSICNQNLSIEQFAEELTDYNSSFTVADYVGIFKVMKEITAKYLAKGYCIELPFCSIRPNVSGTCEGINDAFVPGTKNHTVKFTANVNKDVQDVVAKKLEYKQVSPEEKSCPYIYDIFAVKDDGKEVQANTFEKSAAVRIRGKNLMFSFADEQLGVFFENKEKSSFRVTSFIRRGTNIIDFIVPESLESGEYMLTIKTKPYVSGISTETLRNEITIR